MSTYDRFVLMNNWRNEEHGSDFSVGRVCLIARSVGRSALTIYQCCQSVELSDCYVVVRVGESKIIPATAGVCLVKLSGRCI